MDWNAISAIGTIVAAFVGVAGIWLNIWDKSRRLSVQFEMLPVPRIYLCNNSERTVKITKMRYSVKEHIFDAKLYEGLHEIVLLPHTMQTIVIDKQEMVDSYHSHGLDAICNPTENVDITLFDNYGRRYKFKTGYPIGVFGKM